MSIEETVKKYGFTKKSVRILVKLGVIQGITTEGDMAFLSLLSRIWKDKEWLKESLRQIRSKARREKLVRELELTKPERYVLNRYLNSKGRLTLERVAGELSNYYGLPENVAKGIVRKIRGRAYTAKRRRSGGIYYNHLEEDKNS
jgi:hypothetical protein